MVAMANIPKHLAFTVRYNARLRALVTEVGVSISSSIAAGRTQSIHFAHGLWDTGATGTAITKRLAEQLKLTPIGFGKAQGVGGVINVRRYHIDIYLPNKVRINNLPVIEMRDPPTSHFDILIGMDIIGLGDFCVTKENNATMMSYAFPSIEPIDLVHVADRINSSGGPPAPASRAERRRQDKQKRKRGRR